MTLFQAANLAQKFYRRSESADVICAIFTVEKASNRFKMAKTVSALVQRKEQTKPVHIAISDNSSLRPSI